MSRPTLSETFPKEGSPGPLRDAVKLTYKYADAVAAGKAHRWASQLPASPESIERAVLMVLSAARDPSLLHLLWAVGPKDATFLRDPETISQITACLMDLPSFLDDAEGQVRLRFYVKRGMSFDANGDLVRVGQPALPSLSDPPEERHLLLQYAQITERTQREALRLRAAAESATTYQPPVQAAQRGIAPVSSSGGCALLIGSVIATMTAVVAVVALTATSG